MLIAVASKSGTRIDQHFGHAERFLIYDCAAGKPRLVAEKPVEKYCSFDPDHPFREDKFGAIVSALEGCRAVITAQIGELPKQELEKRGIAAISAVGSIEQAILAAHGTLCGCGFKCDSKTC